MTDEANSHYFSIITELFEGHEWIRNHIGGEFRPTTHWSIDPFGLSPSLPYLLRAANITDAAIQRVHYSVKKHLAKNKQLEFMWRQLWGAHGKSDVRTHMFPFIRMTCLIHVDRIRKFVANLISGLFFVVFTTVATVLTIHLLKRLPGRGTNCPWNVDPQEITRENVRSRAFALYDQYRKKSQLYKTNVLLVPLGDDFRYVEDFEWVDQYQNYMKLFDEMNNNKKWNINARFGTLSDYFAELDRSLRVEQQSLPILSGDFFTYSDRDDHYWSGYFTSRPFYKQMDRVLQHQLRAAEIVFTLWSMKGQHPSDTIFAKLMQARRALSLFQHHDGVTGTAKQHVMKDYGTKMHAALEATEEVLSEGLSSLIGLAVVPGKSILLDEFREQQDSLPLRRRYTVGDFVIVFNPLTRSRDEPVCIRVDSLNAYLKDDSGKEIRQQISPTFELKDGKLFASSEYEVYSILCTH
ncbi:hypothetical protein KIN20_024396 [Parelaphostrongylus tenuis]|uniref:mannosyl-oligosaccharide 1,3-1,6-alpha-mannosidase n=1 Tax=Parelaphostrongylus tenuis TaxID=148309 RepID=A0AAD5N9Y7_PARTN|nr:hypothetical protein KIN20_024396 [Parelaphostrongylus tenuis]